MPGVTCVAPTAAFYAMPKIALPPGKTDEDYVKALLHATGVLCVYGSGFGLPAEDGFLRIVFLASLEELSEIYDLMAAFTAQYSALRSQSADCRLQITNSPAGCSRPSGRSRVSRSCSRCSGRRATRCCWSTSAR